MAYSCEHRDSRAEESRCIFAVIVSIDHVPLGKAIGPFYCVFPGLSDNKAEIDNVADCMDRPFKD